jgi:hypothetical protein
VADRCIFSGTCRSLKIAAAWIKSDMGNVENPCVAGLRGTEANPARRATILSSSGAEAH